MTLFLCSVRSALCINQLRNARLNHSSAFLNQFHTFGIALEAVMLGVLNSATAAYLGAASTSDFRMTAPNSR
jgi:hypothetical protein